MKADWIDAKEKKPMLNVMFLIKDVLTNEKALAWRRAFDGKIEVRGYYKENLIDENYDNYEWMYLPK